MKFRWLPWYSETINTHLKYSDVQYRIQEFVKDEHLLNEFEEYIKKKLGIFSIPIVEYIAFYRKFDRSKFYGPTVERRLIMLSAYPFETKDGCDIKITIELNGILLWLALLVTLFPVIFISIFGDFTSLIPILVFYIICIILYNKGASKLYTRFVSDVLK